MDSHAQFKAHQTAATYVAHGLDETAQEAFEMHMMECPDCVADVEAWRAIQRHMPPARQRSRSAATTLPWRLAAGVLIAAVAGAGGWLARAIQAPGLDRGETVFFNVPAVTRAGEECTPLRLAPGSRTAILRVTGVSRDRNVILLDLERQEIPPARYTQWLQPDGSHVLALDAASLAGKSLNLEARAPDGSGEPLGCVTGTASP
jgi:hypothetical protein